MTKKGLGNNRGGVIQHIRNEYLQEMNNPKGGFGWVTGMVVVWYGWVPLCVREI